MDIIVSKSRLKYLIRCWSAASKQFQVPKKISMSICNSYKITILKQHTCSSLVGISEQLPQTQRSLSVFFISDSVDWWVNRFSLGLATGSSLKGSRPSQSQGRAIIICRSSIERWYQVGNVLPSNERNSQMCMWGGKRHQQTNCMQYCQTGYSIIKHCWPARHQLSSFESLTGAEPRYQPENC